MADEFDNLLESFSDIKVSEDLSSVKHNPTDFSSFTKFQKGLEERFAHSEAEKKKKEASANLLRWDAMLSDRWRGASLSKVDLDEDSIQAAQVISEKIRERKAPLNFYIRGDSGSGKTYIAYAILRRYIGQAWVAPSQIKFVSEEFLIGLSDAGFSGRDRFDELLAPKITTYLFDGVFSRPDLPDRTRKLWEQLIDHIYNRSAIVLFTSNFDVSAAKALLSDSSFTKLENITAGGLIYIGHDEAQDQSLLELLDSPIAKRR